LGVIWIEFERASANPPLIGLEANADYSVPESGRQVRLEKLLIAKRV
jgi:hypothetical protein